jgi:hypothetical protein
VAVELQQANRSDLAKQVGKAWEYFGCADELRVALKYGIEAYRHARVLIER